MKRSLLLTAAIVTAGGSALWASWPEPPPVVTVVVAAPPAVPPTPAAAPRHRTGALAGMVIHLSAGHGYVAHPAGMGWQRPHMHGLLEDTWTATFATDDLIPALERAGALVLTPRERDQNTSVVVADDLDIDFRAEGVVGRDIGSSWAAEQKTRRLSAALAGSTVLSSEGRAVWTLTAPHDGTWQMYATWLAHPEHDPQARYVVKWPGGALEVAVDQTQRGDLWWPLVRIDAQEGDEVQVFLKGSGRGTLSANAVRMGGGTHRVEDTRTRELVELPAWQVASIHHLPVDGAPPEVWGGGGGGYAGDASTRARWANWMHASDEDAVYLSIHTDAGGGTGTTAYIREHCYGRDPDSCDARIRDSERLAHELRSAVVDTARAHFDPGWTDRGTHAAHLAEVNSEVNPAMPAALLEVGFHDHPGDAAVLADPLFREAAADAITAGFIRYRNGADAELPPVAVQGVEWGESVTWADASDARGWRVREERGDGLFGPPSWAMLPAWQPAAGVRAIQITPVNLAGGGRPRVVQRPNDGLVEGP